MNASVVADLHLHSHHSDGVLAPDDLIKLAAARGVTLAALTDHDTTAGLDTAAAAAQRCGIGFVRGVEMSTGWNGQSVHVIALGVPEARAARASLEAHLAAVRSRRAERLQEIGARLQRKTRLPGVELAAAVCGAHDVPTRMHLARALVEHGHARDVGDAFDRWLGHKAPGHVPETWHDLATTLVALRSCGATAVLAHPHRYRLSSGALRRLLGEFREHGGAAMEVSVGGMSQNDLDRLATLARNGGFLASTASDFHDPALPWNLPGRFAKLPAGLESVAAHF
ncbi:MAG: PHP domain-containing protein [Gammaproteobacteria bacterium]|nr:PHP domain-containing protein [Gammaproteobacteria bacterium]